MAGDQLIIQEAACAERVIILKLRVPGRTWLATIGAARTIEGAGLVSPEARREAWGGRLPPGAVRQRAREDALTGARLVRLDPHQALIDQHGDPRVIRIDAGRVVVTDRAIQEVQGPVFSDEALLEERGRSLLEGIAQDAVEIRRTEIVKILERAQDRIQRRREAIRGDLGKIAQADRIASQAQWLVAEAARAPRGATKLVVTDWSTGEPKPMEFPLDPSKSPREQVEAMFKRAKRLRLGARIAEERLAQADVQQAAIAEAALAVTTAPTLPLLEEIVRSAKAKAPRDVALPSTLATGTSTPNKKKARVPHRTFVARSGRSIFVGKGAADNDALTLHVARPHHLWLHAKDLAGAHVIVPLDKNESCPAEDLVDAAHLAAHFSDARDEKVVDVQYVEKRHVRKPKGSPPGFVITDRERVLVLRVEPTILRGLLEREAL